MAKAGRLAVTITAATLAVRMFSPRGVDAEALEHRLQALLGEGRVVEAVAGAVEADHQAVADQLVVAHALDIDDVLDARGRGVGWRQRRAEAAVAIARTPPVRASEAEFGHLSFPDRAGPSPWAALRQ